jgi:putative membrane protein
MKKARLKELRKSNKNKSKLIFFKVIRDDLRFLVKNKIKLIGIIVVCFIPLLYSCLYLDAFWDPYGKLDKLPIAVVNMDKGSEKDNERVNYGNDIIDSLKDNTALKWVFTDYDDANNGVYKNKYYSMLVIPENFSKKITDATDGNVDKATITYVSNQKKNYLASQISSRVMIELKESIANSISNNGTQVVVESLYKAKDGFKDAYDGSTQLSDGAAKLSDGTKELDSTMDELISGADKLKDGSGKLFDGLKEFENQSNDGKKKLVSGAGDLYKGTGDLFSGIKEFDAKISDGENELKDGAEKLVSGFNIFSDGLKEYDEKISSGTKELTDATGKLSDGLSKLTDGFEEYSKQVSEAQEQLNDGAAQIVDGFGKLRNGFSEYRTKVSAGQEKLANGAVQLTDGVSKLQRGLSLYDAQISEGESQIEAGAKDLSSNLSRLSAMLSSSINEDSVTALVEGTQMASAAVRDANSVIEKRELMAKISSMGEDSLSADDKAALLKILGTVQALSNENTGLPAVAKGTSSLSSLSDVVGAVESLSAGAGKLYSGISSMNVQSSAGRKSIISGVNDLKSGALTLAGGLGDLNTQSSDGMSKLSSGLADLNNGANKFFSGFSVFQKKSNDGIKTLSDGADEIKSGAIKLNDGMNTFQEQSAQGRNALINGAAELNDGSEKLYNGISEFQTKGSEARKSLLDGVDKLYSGSETFLSGIKEFDIKTADGTKKLVDGAASLYDGEVQAVDGIKRIKNEGTTPLKDGAAELYDGTTKLSSGLKDGHDQMNDNLKASADDMANFLSDPVELNDEPMYELPNYGTGFTPYFIPLSLWVGALLMFLMIPTEVNKKYKNSPWSIVFGKYTLLGTAGILQAIITSLVVLFGLKLQVQSIPQFIGFNILTSLAFVAIVHCMINIFGDDVGRFFGLVLLMLQLTSCGGTFPMELVPKFFNSLHAWLPMTYAISGLREIISGADYSVLNMDIIILCSLIVTFLLISIAFKSRSEKIKTKILKFKNVKEKVA